MKKNRTAPQAAPAAPAEIPTPPEARQPLLFGLLLGLLVLAFFVYPAAAYPVQALLLTAVALVAGAGLAARLFIARGPERASLLSAMGGIPVLAAFFFILWAVVRWRFAEVPAMGREWIVSLLAMGVCLGLGCGVGATDRLAPAGPTACRTLIRIVTLAALGFGLYALYQYFVSFPQTYAELQRELAGPAADLRSQSLLHAFRERRVAGTLGNPNLFAAQLAVFAFLSLSCVAREQSRLWRTLGAAGAVTALVATLLSQSRGGLLTMLIALGAGALLVANRYRSSRPSAAPTAILFIAFTLFAIHGAWAAHESLAQRIGNIATIRERLFYWDIAIKIWARHPFIGEGPGGYPLLYLTLKSPVARESQHAHSWLFQVGSELGLIGLIPLILFYAGSIGRAFSAWRRRDLAPDAPWLLGALLILALNGLFEFSMQWQAFLCTAGLLGGLVSGLTVPSQLALPSPAARLRGGAGLGLAAAIGILALVCSPPQHLSEARRFAAEDAAQAGQWGDAAQEYARALRLLPDDPNLHMAYAAALSRSGDEPAAWRELEAAARLNPRSAAVYAAQSAWLDRQGRLNEALDKLNQAVERYPSNVQHRLDRARLSLKAERPAQAREDLSFIEKERLPVWEYQQPAYLGLRAQAGLPPVTDIPQ